jgi:prephenate dehydratase
LTDTLTKLGYLGPRGTFSDQAAQTYADRALLLPYDNFALIVAALQAGEIDTALLPIENSSEGPVTDTVDTLIRNEDLVIVEELLLPVEQNLIGVQAARIEDIKAVMSIPPALAQAKRWLDQNIPGIERRTAPSTARAVEMLDDAHPEIAAVGTRIAAQIYGRKILAAGINEYKNNVTRFVAVKRADEGGVGDPSGDDRTTLIMAVPDRPGGLVRALGVFDALEINMLKIESRPRGVAGKPALLGEAIFHIDIDGHRLDPVVAVALEALGTKCDYLRVVGSYKKATLEAAA